MTKIPTSPRQNLVRAIPLALLLLVSANLHADQKVVLNLKGSAEVPPVNTSASGNGTITVLPDHSVTGSIKVTGFVPTMAHIHEAPADKAGPIVVPLNKTASDTFDVPAGTRFTDAQYSSFMAGKLYVNVHSAQNPPGEIRAQIVPAESGGSAPMRPGY